MHFANITGILNKSKNQVMSEGSSQFFILWFELVCKVPFANDFIFSLSTSWEVTIELHF